MWRLEVFGSAAASRFDPATSDLDFLITLEDLRPGQYADNYFGLLEALEELFQRPVDVVVSSAITNPIFCRASSPPAHWCAPQKARMHMKSE